MSVAYPLTVVIVNYRTAALTRALVESLYAAPSVPPAPFETIVIDNASPNGEAAQLAADFARYPHVRLIANPVNTYFSAAYSQGIAVAAGEYILALNPDMLARGNVIGQLLAAVQRDPGIGAATTNLHNPDGTVQRNGSRFTGFGYLALHYTLIGKVWGWLFPASVRRMDARLWYADWDRLSAQGVDVLPGCCIIAHREVWRSAGAFDARMKMYFSDDYFSRRVQALGKRTEYLITDGLIHYEGASAKQVSAWALRVYLADLLVYTRLVFGPLAWLILAVLLIPTYLVQRLRVR